MARCTGARRFRSARARAPCTILASAAALVLAARHFSAAGRPEAANAPAFLFPSTRGLERLNPLEMAAKAMSQPKSSEAGAQGSDEAATTANLGKNIIGTGVLALPAGAAAVVAAGQEAGMGHEQLVIGLVAMFGVFGVLNSAGFYLIGEVCARTGAKSFQEAWGRTMGKGTAWLPSVASLICCLTGTVACASVIGGTATELASVVTGSHFGAFEHQAILFAIASTILTPVCLLPSLAPLAFASVLGVLGMCLLAGVMVLRMFDGSYLPGGEFHDMAALAASSAEAAADPTSCPLKEVFGATMLFSAMLSNAFSAHFNAPAMYAELRDPRSREPQRGEPEGADPESPQEESARQDAKLASFGKVVSQAFAFAAFLCLVVAMVGLQTFGSAAKPLILDNYASGDSLAFVARAGLGLCVLFEFPLLERCFRHTTAELLGKPQAAAHPGSVVASVMLACVIASLPGLEFDTVSAVGGALGSSFLTYVAPALMALQLRKGDYVQADEEETFELPVDLAAIGAAEPPKAAPRAMEAFALQALAVFGVAAGGLGVAQAAGIGPM